MSDCLPDWMRFFIRLTESICECFLPLPLCLSARPARIVCLLSTLSICAFPAWGETRSLYQGSWQVAKYYWDGQTGNRKGTGVEWKKPTLQLMSSYLVPTPSSAIPAPFLSLRCKNSMSIQANRREGGMEPNNTSPKKRTYRLISLCSVYAGNTGTDCTKKKCTHNISDQRH